MLAHVESSRVGLSGASKIGRSPRPLVLKVIEENPGISKEEAFEIFRTELGNDPEYRRALEFYFFVHMWDYAVGPSVRSDPVQRMEAKAQEQDRVESIKAQIIMLEFPMINGKVLGDCTGAELASMNSRFKKLADRVGKAKTVRSVLTEDQVKAIMK